MPVVAGAVAAAIAFALVMVLSDDGEEARAPAATPAPAVTPVAQRGGLAVFARMGCGGCHRLAAARSTGQIGPDLDSVLASHTAESLKAKIIDPTPGTAMPEDFEERLSAAELDSLVRFLLEARR